MVQRVFGQIGSVDADIDITIATCASQEESIRRQVEGDYALVLEPERRDTAPAIMLVARTSRSSGAPARATPSSSCPSTAMPTRPTTTAS